MKPQETKYTLDYFIEKFSKIPNKMWITMSFGEAGGPCCARGHTMNRNKGERLSSLDINPETHALDIIAPRIAKINNWPTDEFKQKRIKTRVIAYLKSLKSNETRNNI